MKYIKTYEQNTDEPQIGDYVLCDDVNSGVADFTLKNIGRVIQEYPYLIQYENIPERILSGNVFHNSTRRMERFEIIMWSSNKEDLEIYLAANKYNL